MRQKLHSLAVDNIEEKKKEEMNIRMKIDTEF